jgi:putative MATE family efflux protein
MLVGVIFLVVSMALRTTYTSSLSADPVTAQLAADYLLWFLPAMALQFCIVAMGSALRGVGLFKPGMVVQTATVIINIVLAPVLIFGWGTGIALGVAGAAIASLIAVVVGVAWLGTYFIGVSSFLMFVKDDLRPQLPLWRDMLKIGLPAGAEFLLMAVYLMLVYALARPFGAGAQAGFGIGMRVVQALFMPIVALGFSVAPVAGQNVGARLASRVRAVFKDASLMAGFYMLGMALLCNVAPASLIAIFSDDPAVVHVGDEYLRIISWNFVASGLIFVCSSMFQAMGNTVPSLVASATRIVVIAVPALLLARLPGFELRWIWYVSVAAVFLQLAIVLTLLRREFRVRLDAMTDAPLTSSAPAAG